MLTEAVTGARSKIWLTTAFTANRDGTKLANNLSSLWRDTMPEDTLPKAADAKDLQKKSAASTSEKTKAWLAENRGAMESSIAYVAAHGLPLAKYRMF
jgi:post-segregation antitoxin (ccd killing protein)